MLPLVLGGIALAAVGYGVKEFCESEGCPWDDIQPYAPVREIDLFEELHSTKIDVYENSFKALYRHLSNMENLKKMPLDVWTINPIEEKLPSSDITSEIKLYANIYTDILSESNHIFKVSLTKVETMLETTNNYKNYNKEDKEFLQKIYSFMNDIHGIFSMKLLDDYNTMNVDSIIILRVFEALVDKNK